MGADPTFGTDGIRGLANRDLTAELALRLGRAAVRALGVDRAVIGRDTRRSGPMLEAAVAAGVASVGADVKLLDVVPTPAVAHAARAEGAVGVVVSASHNPFADNGIKLFSTDGRKLDDAAQAAVADALDEGPGAAGPVGERIGTIDFDDEELASGWTQSIVGSVRAGSDEFAALRVVLDCAHGAATGHGQEILERLGVDLVGVVGADPDGVNINDGVGATATGALARAVKDLGADLGLALDGDADRLIAVDAGGQVVDGDQILAILARDRHDRGALDGGTVVTTVMANLGFRRAMTDAGIKVIETPVGDRHVTEALIEHGAVLGGEQSGHLIFADLATTGDGLLSAAQLLDTLVTNRWTLGQAAAEAMVRLPQVLRNVGTRLDPVLTSTRLAPLVDEFTARFGGAGRVLVRPSGTEPVVRVMVEAATVEEAEVTADELCARIAGELDNNGG